MNKFKIYCIVGCSASGKDRILNTLLKECVGLTSIVSTTSRPKRVNEVEGREYCFVTKEKAEEMLKNKEFLECRKYNVASGDTWYYGMTKKSIDVNSSNNYIVILDFHGLLELEDYLTQNNCMDSLTSIYIDCSYQTRLIRSLEREGEIDDIKVKEIIRRFGDDNNRVLPAKNYCNFVINNDGSFTNTINRILDIMED